MEDIDLDIDLPTPPQRDLPLPSFPRRLPPSLAVTRRKRSLLRQESGRDDDEGLGSSGTSSNPNTSSDAALFSSDETPDAENYSPDRKRRKKKRWTGTWWGDRVKPAPSRQRKISLSAVSVGSVASSNCGSTKRSREDEGVGMTIDTRSKRKFIRNFDSGVFMASDEGNSAVGTDLSSDSSFSFERELMEEQRSQFKKAAQRNTAAGVSRMRAMFARPDLGALSSNADPRSNYININENLKSTTLVTPKKRIAPGSATMTPTTMHKPGHSDVQRRVQYCLEHEKEDVDLDSLNLETLPTEILDLRSLVNTTLITDHTRLLAEGQAFAAKLRLYLANNAFKKFPHQLFNLPGLALLSVRQNQLTELPPGMRNLTRLEFLNVAGNELQCLPWEVLELVRNKELVKVVSEPNPWLPCPVKCQERTPESRPPPDYEGPDGTSHGGRWEFYYRIAIGEVHDVNADGTYPAISPIMARRPRSQKQEEGNSGEDGESHVEPPSRAPRLSELVLRKLNRINPVNHDLAHVMPEETSPNVMKMLKALRSAQLHGGKKCSNPACGRELVIPAKRWTEWWDIRNLAISVSLLKHGSDSRLLDEEEDDQTSGQLYSQPQVVPFDRHACGQCDLMPGGPDYVLPGEKVDEQDG